MQKVEKLMTIPTKLIFYEQIREAAREEDLTISAWVRLTLRKEIEAKKEKGATGNGVQVHSH